MVGIRVVLAVAFPTFATILGFLWFHRKKKNPSDFTPREDGDCVRNTPQCQESCKEESRPTLSAESEKNQKETVEDISEDRVTREETAVVFATPSTHLGSVTGSITTPAQCEDTEEAVDGSSSSTLKSVQSSSVNTAPEQLPDIAPDRLPDTASSNRNNTKTTHDATTHCKKPSETATKSPLRNCQGNQSEQQQQQSSKPLQEKLPPRQVKANSRGSGSNKVEKKRATEKPSLLNSHSKSPASKDTKLPSTSHELLEADEMCRTKHESCNGASSLGSSSSASPVENGSNGSDVQSELSADSGHGPSLSDLTSPISPVKRQQHITTFQFDFPTKLCGKLIGKNGRHINIIKDRSDAEIAVKRKLHTQEYQLVQLKGTEHDVRTALSLIKQRFPPRKFHISYKEVVPDNDGPVLPAEIMQLGLPEGCTVDVLVSSVVTPNHIFVQQPTHPTFPMLEKQNQFMMMCYGQDGIVPQLPRPVEVGVICAAPMFNGWYRAQIVQTYPDTDECDIKFVDYGGYMRVASFILRQIRSDFTSLPFQAVECYLANVVPPKDLETFPSEANALLEQMVHGRLIQAEIVSHEEDGVPYVQLYQCLPDETVLINRELVNQGVASWLELPTDPCL